MMQITAKARTHHQLTLSCFETDDFGTSLTRTSETSISRGCSSYLSRAGRAWRLLKLVSLRMARTDQGEHRVMQFVISVRTAALAIRFWGVNRCSLDIPKVANKHQPPMHTSMGIRVEQTA